MSEAIKIAHARMPQTIRTSALRPEFVWDWQCSLGEHVMDAPDYLPCGGLHTMAYDKDHEILVCGHEARDGMTGGWCREYHWPRPGEEWWASRTKMAELAAQPKPRGGKRKGAGRKRLDPDGSVAVCLRLTAKQKATYDLAGGAAFVRHELDRLAGDLPKDQP